MGSEGDRIHLLVPLLFSRWDYILRHCYVEHAELDGTKVPLHAEEGESK